MTDPLSALVLRAADGDRAAFDLVYDEIGPRVDALCARIVGPGADAEDAAQHALIRVFERVSEYDPERGPALGWVLSLTAWEARTVRRRRGRSREDVGRAPDAEAPADDDPWDELRALLDLADPADRAVVLAALDRAPRPDTAPATFRKRLQRAVERLRARFAPVRDPSSRRTP